MYLKLSMIETDKYKYKYKYLIPIILRYLKKYSIILVINILLY